MRTTVFAVLLVLVGLYLPLYLLLGPVVVYVVALAIVGLIATGLGYDVRYRWRQAFATAGRALNSLVLSDARGDAGGSKSVPSACRCGAPAAWIGRRGRS